MHDSNPNTIIQAWKGNASSLASEGVAAVDSEPNKFYVCCSKSTPGVTRAWSDLGKSEVPKENRHLHLGGEVAFWTDAYCYLNDCVRPGSGAGGGHHMFDRRFDAEFSRSVGGIMWPRTHLAAGSFWNFRDDLSTDEVAQRANYKHNTLAAQRGGLVCPSGCDCDLQNICDEPIIPPTPPPPSPAPSSKHCHWQVDTGLAGNDIHKVSDVEDQRGCCAVCHETEGCAAADYNFLTKTCHLKNDINSVWRNDGSVACIPIVTTTTTTPSSLSV